MAAETKVCDSKSSSDDHPTGSSAVSFDRKKIRILLMEKISQRAVDYFVEQGFTVETADKMTEKELAAKLPSVHVIGVRSKTKLTANLLRNYGKKLLCTGCFCIGTDQTDLSVAAGLGVPVFNSPFANTRSVAELIISNIIALARQLGDQNKWMHQGLWRKTAVGCYEVRGKTLGIVGYGHVGSQTSVLAEALGLKVIFYDHIPKLPLGNAQAVSSLQHLLTVSDFVTLHVPLDASTEGMIGAKELSTMKKGSYFLNAARGKCVDIEAVAKALRSGHLAGAYFDVYPAEPTDTTLVLRDCPNTILSPHIGGSTQEAQRAIALDVATKITRYINEGVTTAAVNLPEVAMDPNVAVHRVLNFHRNVPGVLKKINAVLSEFNVSAQVLRTQNDIGYILVDIDADKSFSDGVKKQLDGLGETIRTRILYSPGSV